MTMAGKFYCMFTSYIKVGRDAMLLCIFFKRSVPASKGQELDIGIVGELCQNGLALV
jgi:hypothetical protein